MKLTKAQVELARHALGLPNKKKQSYRCYFVTGPGSDDYDEWKKMAATGHAIRFDGAKLMFGGNDYFRLTLKGALAALNPDESLSREDFPITDAGRAALRAAEQVKG